MQYFSYSSAKGNGNGGTYIFKSDIIDAIEYNHTISKMIFIDGDSIQQIVVYFEKDGQVS